MSVYSIVRHQGRKALKRELTAVMNRKQKLALAIRSQFRQPHGFVGWLAGWEMALRSSNRQRHVWAVGLLGVEPTDRVLDIGCGPGIAIRELSRRATHGLVCGVDHSAVMVRQATRRNAEAVRAVRVVLRLGAAEHLPAFAEPFDKVLAVNNMGMWHAPDGDGELQLCGHAEDAVFHRGRASAWKDRHSDGGISQRLDLSLERLIEHGVHARAPTHRAGFV
jgi:SAM-dependent methyltransferase